MLRVLTEDGPSRHRLSVEPEGHLGQDDGHEAGHVRLDHKVADLPLQKEARHHDGVLAWGREDEVRRTRKRDESSV